MIISGHLERMQPRVDGVLMLAQLTCGKRVERRGERMHAATCLCWRCSRGMPRKRMMRDAIKRNQRQPSAAHAYREACRKLWGEGGAPW